MGSDVTLGLGAVAADNCVGACVLRNCLNIDPATLGVCAGAVFCGITISSMGGNDVEGLVAASYIDQCTTNQSGEDAIVLSSPVDVCCLLALFAACVLL